MRPVKLLVGNKAIGTALTWAYPYGQHHGIFTIPTYELAVSGKDNKGIPSQRKFEVLRFGVQGKKNSAPRVVGLANQQTHIIKSWLPNYTVHSARSLEKGAWQVYDNFLIHDGPDNPKKQVYASIGCIEICNGPEGFNQFNDYIISLSGSSSPNRTQALREIGQAKNIMITYLKAIRPSISRFIP